MCKELELCAGKGKTRVYRMCGAVSLTACVHFIFANSLSNH